MPQSELRIPVSTGVPHQLRRIAFRLHFSLTSSRSGLESCRWKTKPPPSSSSARFVGRKRELEELSAAIENARRGGGRIFLVSGEPRIGKSRLPGEAAALGRIAHCRAQGLSRAEFWRSLGFPNLVLARANQSNKHTLRLLEEWKREELRRTPFAILDEPPPELSPVKRPRQSLATKSQDFVSEEVPRTKRSRK